MFIKILSVTSNFVVKAFSCGIERKITRQAYRVRRRTKKPPRNNPVRPEIIAPRILSQVRLNFIVTRLSPA
jgi:hypothetical protein